MKLVSKLFLASLFATLLFTSCEKDNINDSGVTPDPTTELETNPLIGRSGGGNEDGLDIGCFVINYPFTLLKMDGTTITIADEDELESVESTLDEEVVDFVYPISVTMTDGELVTVVSVDGLGELFANCIPEGGWDEEIFPAYQIGEDNSCYSLKYPVDLTDDQGVTVTVSDEASFNAAIAEKIYFFNWPLVLIHEDGEEVSVSNVDAMFDVLLSCNDWGWENSDSTIWEWETGFEYIGCYMVEFPLSVIVSGEVVVVENHEELCDLMLQGQLEGYAYPLTLTSETGEVVTVASEGDLDALLDDCWDDGVVIGIDLPLLYFGSTGDQGFPACFNIQYPISVEDPIFGNVTFENQTELAVGVEDSSFCCLVYPVSVEKIADGSIVTFDSSIDLLEGIETLCE